MCSCLYRCSLANWAGKSMTVLPTSFHAPHADEAKSLWPFGLFTAIARFSDDLVFGQLIDVI